MKSRIKIKYWLLMVAIFLGLFSVKAVYGASITINTDRDRIATGEEVNITGRIDPRKNNVQIRLAYSYISKGPYHIFKTTETNKKGEYSFTLTPKKTKFIKVSYLRNGNVIKSERKKIVLDDDLIIVAPYVNESEISSVNEAYSMSENAPWGFIHPGVDFMIASGTTPVQAVTDGVITNAEIIKDEGQMGWHVFISIEYGEYVPMYNLETFSQSDETGVLAEENLFVEVNQVVKQGDIIANLVYGGDGAHIDFGIGYGGTRVCPEPYFTEEAAASVNYLITKDHPDWPMCYEE